MTDRESKESIGQTASEVQQRIGKIYDHLYANASMRTPSGISTEVGKVLHATMYKEESSQEPAFQLGQSEINGLTDGSSLFGGELAGEVRSWFKAMNKAWGLYEPQAEILLDDFDLNYTCAQLNNLVVSDHGRDVFGDALEIFRSQWTKRAGGQFFTDQRVASLAISILRFDPREGEDLVDISAGTGGFLLAGLNHIAQSLEGRTAPKSIETDIAYLASKSIKGQEVDKEVSDIANATLLSRIGTTGDPLVLVGDSLKPEAFESDKENSGIRFNSHYCVATNPPFGTKITVKDRKVLQHFDLAKLPKRSSNGKSRVELVSPRAPDILLLEQNVKLLKPGVGRLAIVLPYQILSGPQTQYIREWLFKHTQLIAVVDLPADTFQPHTGTKASLVVVKRREHPLQEPIDAEDPPVFMSMPRWIGHDRRGHPIYDSTHEGKSAGEILTDFPEVRSAFELFERGGEPESEHSLSFRISPAAIAEDPMLRMNALFHRTSSKRKMGVSIAQRESWRTVQIKDVVKKIFYPGRFKRNYVDYSPEAVPFLGGANISQLTVTTEKWLSENDRKLEALRVFTGWVLVTRSGSTGIIYSVPPAWNGFAMSEHVIRIIPDPEKLDPAYIQAYLRSAHGQEQLTRGIFGSVIDEITPEFIGQIEMPVPHTDAALASVASRVREAETARQQAIEGLSQAVEELNKKL